jgi:hypothetical protein
MKVLQNCRILFWFIKEELKQQEHHRATYNEVLIFWVVASSADQTASVVPSLRSPCLDFGFRRPMGNRGPDDCGNRTGFERVVSGEHSQYRDLT